MSRASTPRTPVLRVTSGEGGGGDSTRAPPPAVTWTKLERSSSSLFDMRMPFPPPPSDALSITG